MLWAAATLSCSKMKRRKRLHTIISTKNWQCSNALPDHMTLYDCTVSVACHCIQRPGGNCTHKACQVKTKFYYCHLHNIIFVCIILYIFRLYAKLNEDEEAAKLYNRFVAQAETSDVSFASLLDSNYQCLDSIHLYRLVSTSQRSRALPTCSWPSTT